MCLFCKIVWEESGRFVLLFLTPSVRKNAEQGSLDFFVPAQPSLVLGHAVVRRSNLLPSLSRFVRLRAVLGRTAVGQAGLNQITALKSQLTKRLVHYTNLSIFERMVVVHLLLYI